MNAAMLLEQKNKTNKQTNATIIISRNLFEPITFEREYTQKLKNIQDDL